MASCVRCGGLWLSAANLAAKGAKLGPDLVAASSNAPGRACPTCALALGTYRSPLVEIDACDRCTGVFLDRGELEILLKATAPAPGKAKTFACSRCGKTASMRDQIIGSSETVCRSCAAEGAIRHAPADRRQALKQQGAAGAVRFTPSSSSSGSDSSGWETAGAVTLGALEVAFDILDIFS